MEILIILFLIFLNSFFAMAEVAIISARKAHLKKMANEGDKSAEKALQLASSPSQFFSTIQIAVTLIGILCGVFGGATIARKISLILQDFAILPSIADFLAFLLVVIFITYFSLVLGELVPKRLALNSPEKIASLTAKPLLLLASISSPLVNFLSVSTDWFLNLLGIKPKNTPTVSEEEIKMLIKEGAQSGVLDLAEKDIVERTLKFGDKKVKEVMTARNKIVWLDIKADSNEIRRQVMKNLCSYFPVGEEGLDEIKGVVRTEDLLKDYLAHGRFNLKKILLKPLFVPENTPALRLMELFKKTGVYMALVVNEYGNLQGVVSLTDILEGIVGDIPTVSKTEEVIIRRDQNSWFVDGAIPIDKFKDFFKINNLPGEKTGSYHSVGGFVMYKLGRVPSSGDSFDLESYRFEVVDMDENRVDKILITRLS